MRWWGMSSGWTGHCHGIRFLLKSLCIVYCVYIYVYGHIYIDTCTFTFLCQILNKTWSLIFLHAHLALCLATNQKKNLKRPLPCSAQPRTETIELTRGELFRGFLSAERLGTTLPSTLGYKMTSPWSQLLNSYPLLGCMKGNKTKWHV